ncbi:NAD(P)/FAD-dependent oxidoreductase [Caulobacter segnis]
MLGPDLMARMGEQVRKAGVEVVSDLIVEVDLTRAPFCAVGDGGARYTADTIVVATGASARWLGLQSETEYRGRGVSACATCDGFFYRGRVCAVVGGGNTAVEEALYLTNFAEKVYLIHRRDTLRADRTNQARLHANPEVEMVWNAEVAEVLGDGGGVTGRYAARYPDRRGVALGGARAVHCDRPRPRDRFVQGPTAYGRRGLYPRRAWIHRDQRAGVFAAGDVQDKLFRQAVTSAGMGCAWPRWRPSAIWPGATAHAIAAEGADVDVLV